MCIQYSLIEKSGMNAVLKPFIDDLRILYDHGIDIKVNNNNFILVFLADNLASHLLAGLKMSFLFAFRSCRSCMVPTKEISLD